MSALARHDDTSQLTRTVRQALDITDLGGTQAVILEDGVHHCVMSRITQTECVIQLKRMLPRPDATLVLRRALDLTDAQANVAYLLILSCSIDAIAERLGISRHTARHHTENIFAKLGSSTRSAVEQICSSVLVKYVQARAGYPAPMIVTKKVDSPRFK